MSHVPSVNRAYDMVVSDECQKFASSSISVGLNAISSIGLILGHVSQN